MDQHADVAVYQGEGSKISDKKTKRQGRKFTKDFLPWFRECVATVEIAIVLLIIFLLFIVGAVRVIKTEIGPQLKDIAPLFASPIE